MWALRPHSAAVVRSVPVCGAAGTWAARCVRPLSVTASPLWPVGVHVGGGGVGGGVAFAVAVAGNDVSVSRVFVDATSRRRCSALAATGQSRGRRTGRLGADARHVHGGYGDSGDSGGVGGGGGSDIIGGSGGGGGDMLHAAQRAAATGNVMECIAVLGQASRDDLQGAVGTALFNATLSATLYRLRWGHRSGRSKLIATDDMWARGGVRGRGFDLGPPPRQFLDVPPFVERAMDTVGCTRDPTTHYLLIMTYALVGSARAAASRLRDSLQAKRNGLRNATKPATAVIRRLLMAQVSGFRVGASPKGGGGWHLCLCLRCVSLTTPCRTLRRVLHSCTTAKHAACTSRRLRTPCSSRHACVARNRSWTWLCRFWPHLKKTRRFSQILTSLTPRWRRCVLWTYVCCCAVRLCVAVEFVFLFLFCSSCWLVLVCLCGNPQDPEPLQSMMELCRRYPEAVDDNLTQRQLLQHYLRSMPLKAAVRKVSELLGHDVRTDLTLFVQLINACAESGDASQAESLFASLREFGLAPNSTAYGALLKAHIAAKDLARCGASREGIGRSVHPPSVSPPCPQILIPLCRGRCCRHAS